ncbi:MAG: pro-sigmaK processing inhibitor BofA family protein [Evtepia sp.]
MTVFLILASPFILYLVRKPFGYLLRVFMRSGVGLLFLYLCGKLGLGFSLGVNCFNALTLGVLGLPGFGLLYLLRWLMQAT